MEKANPKETAAGQHVQDKLDRQECVFMDGGIATELGRMEIDGYEVGEGGLWGSMALYKAPGSVVEAHRGYIEAGCDVISTATWELHMDDPEYQALKVTGSEEAVHWMDAARLGIRLARQAIEESGGIVEIAVLWLIVSTGISIRKNGWSVCVCSAASLSKSPRISS